VCGFTEYLIGDHRLISYDYVRKSLGKKRTLELSLVPLSEVDLMIPEATEDSLIDMVHENLKFF
jgi:hypothetical protein